MRILSGTCCLTLIAAASRRSLLEGDSLAPAYAHVVAAGALGFLHKFGRRFPEACAASCTGAKHTPRIGPTISCWLRPVLRRREVRTHRPPSTLRPRVPFRTKSRALPQAAATG